MFSCTFFCELDLSLFTVFSGTLSARTVLWCHCVCVHLDVSSSRRCGVLFVHGTPGAASLRFFSFAWHAGGSGCTTPLGSQNGTAPPRRSNSAGKLSSRAHNFCTKTLVRSESCGPCGKRIGFYKTALKCLTCRSTCHPECKDQVRTTFPGRTKIKLSVGLCTGGSSYCQRINIFRHILQLLTLC